jgi:hypothetical protein
LDKSFEANSFLGATRHQEKIQASLDRLDSALSSVRSQMTQREEAAAAANQAAAEAASGRIRHSGRERSAPSSRASSCDRTENGNVRVPGNRKTRSRSGGGGYGGYGRRPAAAARPVTTISAPQAATAAGACRSDAGSAQGQRCLKPPAQYGRPPRV